MFPKSICYDIKSRITVGFNTIIKNDIDGVSDLDLRSLLNLGSVYDNKIYFAIDALKIVDNGKASKFPVI